MRNPTWLALLSLLQGCYLFHGVPGDGADDAAVPGPSADAALALDAGPDAGPPVIRPPDPRGDAGPPPVFVPDGGVLVVERPDEAITCDNGDEVLAEVCGTLPVVYVASDGRAGGTGTALDPFGALDTALAACGARCAVRIERGELSVERIILPERSCVWISGGWARERDAWTPTDAHTVLNAAVSGTPSPGALLQTRSRLLVERVSIRGTSWGISAEAPSELLVVRDTEVDVSGLATMGIVSSGAPRDPAPTASGVRICRTWIRNARYGMLLADRTLDAIVDDVDIDHGVASEGLRITGARRVLIRRAMVRARGGTALVVSDGAQHVTIEDSDFDARQYGAHLDPTTSHVLVARSTLLGCEEPVVTAVGASSIQIVETTLGACTFGAE